VTNRANRWPMAFGWLALFLIPGLFVHQGLPTTGMARAGCPAGYEIAWAEAVVAGEPAAEVRVDGVCVFRLLRPAGGLTTGERAGVVCDRLRGALQADDPGEAYPCLVQGRDDRGAQLGLRLGDTFLVTVDAATARAGGTQPLALAVSWANNLRRALRQSPLPSGWAGTLPGRPEPAAPTFSGWASWYGMEFSGRRTASGERFDPDALTAAHRWLPFGTIVRVTATNSGRSVLARINDRGPWITGRIIDLSRRAARIIGLVSAGVLPVQVDVVSWPAEESV